MYRRRLSLLAAALAYGGLSPTPGLPQSALAPARAAIVLGPGPVWPSALKASYHLRLTSMWPQEDAANGCRNGGEEVVEGSLTRTADGNYAGTLTRRTELLFCGAHGAAAQRCALALNGRGSVAMTGEVENDAASPSGRSVRVTWTPAGAHEVAVTGACPTAFKDAVQAMYLTTPHAAEFALIGAGAGPRTERLENYAWRVEVE